MKNNRKTIIVGAGIAGLTLASKMCCDGNDVLLVEKESSVGGLAKSFTYGDYVFDIGPHRFHTDNPDVLAFIHDVLDDDYIAIQRKSGVWMFDRYFEWPLKLSAMFRMPPSVLFSVGMDFLSKKRNLGTGFEAYIISRYGKTLYEIFFKPYTEKFLGIPCSQVSRDWAVTGIDRAVIDRKIRVDDLLSLAKSLVFSEPPLNFLYPASGGIGVFSEKLKKRIFSNGGQVLLNAEITKIITKDSRISTVIINGEEHACDLLVWTAPVTEISRLLGHDKAELSYLDLILYNYRLSCSSSIDYQWCYFGSDVLPFNRVSIPSNFNPSLAPPGTTGLCVEVTCQKGDQLWANPEKAEPAIRRALSTVGVVKSGEAINGFTIENIPNAYPVYTLDYGDTYKAASDRLSKVDNLKLLGRSGTFWYNNMDNSIEEALNLYTRIRTCPDCKL